MVFVNWMKNLYTPKHPSIPSPHIITAHFFLLLPYNVWRLLYTVNFFKGWGFFSFLPFWCAILPMRVDFMICIKKNTSSYAFSSYVSLWGRAFGGGGACRPKPATRHLSRPRFHYPAVHGSLYLNITLNRTQCLLLQGRPLRTSFTAMFTKMAHLLKLSFWSLIKGITQKNLSLYPAFCPNIMRLDLVLTH